VAQAVDEMSSYVATPDPWKAATDVARFAFWLRGRLARGSIEPKSIVVSREQSKAEKDARETEQKEQAGLLRDIIPFPADALCIEPEWLTWHDGTIRRLALSIYEDRELPSGTLDVTKMAILADALEEAGCTNAGILEHCRGPGPHVRGCWALDLLLGRT
jgi:hypothetical protein